MTLTTLLDSLTIGPAGRVGLLIRHQRRTGAASMDGLPAVPCLDGLANERVFRPTVSRCAAATTFPGHAAKQGAQLP
jgi:hypothetical protein